MRNNNLQIKEKIFDFKLRNLTISNIKRIQNVLITKTYKITQTNAIQLNVYDINTVCRLKQILTMVCEVISRCDSRKFFRVYYYI